MLILLPGTLFPAFLHLASATAGSSKRLPDKDATLAAGLRALGVETDRPGPRHHLLGGLGPAAHPLGAAVFSSLWSCYPKS